MEQALLEQIHLLPESLQQEALQYIESLVAKHNQSVQAPKIDRSDLDRYLTLPLHHRDPFDRLIIAQAIDRELILISADGSFEPYPVKRIW